LLKYNKAEGKNSQSLRPLFYYTVSQKGQTPLCHKRVRPRCDTKTGDNVLLYGTAAGLTFNMLLIRL